MAGFSGMGTPQSLAPSVPESPDLLNQALSVQLPPAQPAEPDRSPASSDMDALFAQHGGEVAPAPANELDALFAQHGGSDLTDAEAQAQADAAEQSFTDTNSLFSPEGLSAQLSDTIPRVKAGFAKTAAEKQQVLEQTYGADNVRKTKDGFLVKKNGKFVNFDKKTFELINDVVGEGRSIIEGAGAALGGGVAAGLAGLETAATAGAGGLAAPAIIAAGGAAGAGLGTNVADAIQAGLGINRDPERSRVGETALAAGLGGLFSGTGAFIEQKLAGRAAAQKLSGVLAPEVNANAAAQDAVEVATRLRDEHKLIGNIPGTDTPILPSQANLLSGEAQANAQKLAKDKTYQGAVLKTGQMVADGFQKVADGFANLSGSKSGLGEKFISGAETITKAEGKLIGDYEAQAIKSAGNKEIEVKALADKVREIGTELGMVVKDNKLVVPSVEELTQQGFSERGAKILQSNLVSLEGKLYNKEALLTPNEIKGLYKQWSGLLNNTEDLKRAGDGSYRYLAQIKRAITDTHLDAIGQNLEGTAANDFLASRAQYGALKDAAGKLSSLLDKDEVTANALAKGLFNKSAASLDKIRAAKTLVENQDPAIWKDIVGQHFADVVAKHTTPATVKNPIATNWTQVKKEFESLGPEVLAEIIPPKNKQAFDDILKYGSNVFQGSSGVSTESEKGALMKVISGLSKFLSPKDMGIAILSKIDGSQSLLKTISKEGVDAVTKNVPKADRGPAKVLLNAYLKSGQQRAAQAAGIAARSTIEGG